MPFRDAGGEPLSCWARVCRATFVSLLVSLASGCGGQSMAPAPGEPLPAVDAGSGAAPPPLLTDSGAAPEPADAEPTPAGIAEVPDVASGGSPSGDVVASGLLEMLQVYCGDCHSNGDNGAGFASGIDLAALIAAGLIVPGSSAASPLLQRILDGSMPPGTRRPTVGDIDLLTRFIDQLSAQPAPTCGALPFLDLDTAYSVMLADLRGRPEADRPFLRYLGIGDTSNTRRCGAALDQQRQALSKLVNSLSTADTIHIPAAIDAAALLYRIDLRDYGWAREIDLDGDGVVDHADGWEALLPSAAPYAVELGGPEASALAAEAGTKVPFLPVSVFVGAASVGDVYYALLGIGTNHYDVMLGLGLDMEADLLDLDLQRAASVRPSRLGDGVVSRFRQGEPAGRSLWLMDIQDQVRGGTIFDDPVGFINGDWSQTIIELKNGLFAYSMNDGGGARVVQRPRTCVQSCYRPVEQHAIACMGCHATGLLPVEDFMREYVETNRAVFDAETYADTLAIYPPAADFAVLVSGSNERYLAALAQAGVAVDAPDPVSAVYLDRQRPLDLERAAAELGVPSLTLSQNLGGLLPAFAPLATPAATIERTAFGAAYAEALCVLQTRNRPLVCP